MTEIPEHLLKRSKSARARMEGGEAPTDDAPSVDDQFQSLLAGLRTTLPGVQVLVGFLLTVPLQTGFETADATDRAAYYVAFLAALTSSVLLISPSVHQRLRAPMTGVPRRSERHLHTAVWLAIVGTASFAVALVASMVFVTQLLGGIPLAVTVAGVGVALLIAWAWVWLPLVRFREQS